MFRSLFLCLLVSGWVHTQAQDRYQYTVDLRNIKNDQLHIELVPPRIAAQQVVFHLPKIIPGTYNNADYGRFLHNLNVVDKNGKRLAVKQLDANSWEIRNATAIARISYDVDDTWDSEIPHEVYDMSGTNIEAGKNVVLNTPGFFGFFEGMTKVPFEVTVTRPDNFYASTPLVAKKSVRESDVFLLDDADHLYDSPIMYCVPDTTTIRVANTSVLISVYSPKKTITSDKIAGKLRSLLMATKDYLGGKLPVEKYAFIFYFNSEQAPLKKTGALEHNYSSFYALPEIPFETIAPLLVDISAHEFFHIVTPLTISSREVKHFNFSTPVLSKHLWLYEGSTEYAAHHVQVTQGLNTPEEFLGKLTEKIQTSRGHFKDDLPFTELSKHSADKHNDQYTNVYQKGALISACLDLYLLRLSDGRYGIRNLIHDLSVKYGKEQYFNDDELFDEITRLTYPEVRQFFNRYVEGPDPIPYQEYFGFAGVDYVDTPTPTLGKISIGFSPEGRLTVASTAEMNEFGKAMGYQNGDEFVTLNGHDVNSQNAQAVIQDYLAKVKAGDIVEIKVLRKSSSGTASEVVLSAPMKMTRNFALRFNANPTPEQLRIRTAWLDIPLPAAAPGALVKANPMDVESIDSIVKNLYAVISGPAGERDWNRFRSLFYPGAKLGAMERNEKGKLAGFKFMSPEEYVETNAPYFKQFEFTEKELQRVTKTFGDIGQVFSSYEYELKMPQQTVTQRGVNSIALLREGGRWWISSLTWQDESADLPLPAELKTAPPNDSKTKKKKK